MNRSHPKTTKKKEIHEYLKGERKKFSRKVKLVGTPFQKKIWKLTREIPFGRTLSYGELARKAGLPRGARAVARALAKNPLPIVVPCHRVIAQDGGLAGFAWGVSLKRKLLEYEASCN